MSAEDAICAEGLGHKYGRQWAVRRLDLHVPAGKIYGFLGLNGAGKSTTIRMLMGLIRRQEGSVRVQGIDPQVSPVALKSIVGYVAETHNFYEWMTVEEITAFVAHYRPQWDKALAESLREGFLLDPAKRIAELSKGQKAKLSLLLALAFRPRLLILDEPASGLDPTARREFFEGVLSGFQEEGGTIFVSSHLVNEISGIVDHIGLIQDGHMRFEMPLEDLRASVKRIRLVFPDATPAEIACPGLLRCKANGREAVVSVRDYGEQVLDILRAYKPSHVSVEDMNLEDIFVELVAQKA